MRLFLHFAVLCCFLVNVWCASQERPKDPIFESDGTKSTKDGTDGLQAEYNNYDCDLFSNLKVDILPEEFNSDFYDVCRGLDTYMLSYLGLLITFLTTWIPNFIGHTQANKPLFAVSYLSRKYDELEKSRGSCFNNERWITVGCSVKGFILTCIVGSLIVSVFCYVSSGKLRAYAPPVVVLTDEKEKMDPGMRKIS